MRHFLANILTYAIAALLFIGAAAFAWMRSSQLMLTTEPAVLAQYEPAAPGFRWQQLGRESYERNCVNCHRSDGSGWDQYPPLAPIAGEAATGAGRDYLIDLHLYGLTSARWGAPMPSMAHIHDVELAAVINYMITTFGTPAGDAGAGLLTPADVAARRGRDLSPRDVDATRPSPGPPDG